MQSRTVARELALLMLGQTSDRQAKGGATGPATDTALDTLLHQSTHCGLGAAACAVSGGVVGAGLLYGVTTYGPAYGYAPILF
mgnify:CR=1 FL=1